MLTALTFDERSPSIPYLLINYLLYVVDRTLLLTALPIRIIPVSLTKCGVACPLLIGKYALYMQLNHLVTFLRYHRKCLSLTHTIPAHDWLNSD